MKITGLGLKSFRRSPTDQAGLRNPQREGGSTNDGNLYAEVASDLLEKEEAIQSQREAPRSHAADDGHEVTIEHLIAALWNSAPYQSVYSVDLRFIRQAGMYGR